MSQKLSKQKNYPESPSPMFNCDVLNCCYEILKYLQVYESYRSIVGQERGRTHKDLNERRKINQILTKLILI